MIVTVIMKRKGPDRPPAAVAAHIEDSARVVPLAPVEPVWPGGLRVAFRFVFLYVSLFCLATQIAGSLFMTPGSSFRGFGLLWPMRPITTWIATHVFGATEPLVYGRFSGETLFYWVQMFWIFLAAVAGTVIWSVVDRRRENYARLQQWFHLAIRLALAASMFEYGMAKVISTQFPQPPLNTLVTPLGNMTLSGLLWAAIGASPAYEAFTGVAELLGGILLLMPRTAMLGALICLADAVQVFALNMTFDIGVKQISFHLILMSLLVLAPDARRLLNFFVLNRPAGPSSRTELFRSNMANRVALAIPLVIGVYLLGTYAYVNWTFRQMEGDASPRSPLYGIWNVDQLSVDGEVGPVGLNDYDRRWRRVIFDAPNAMAVQRTDDSFARYVASVNVYQNSIALTKGGSKTWRASLTFRRPSPERLVLEGEMDGYKILAQLQLAEFDTFRLLNSSFRWIRPEDQ